MVITADDISSWCEQLLEPRSIAPLDDYVDGIPALDSLVDVPPTARVLVRCDTNVIVGHDGVIENDARLKSLLETLEYGRERGWVQIVHGHLGIDGQLTQRPVADRLGQLLGCRIEFLPAWMDDSSGEVLAETDNRLNRLEAGAVAMLENARRCELETCLWRPRPTDLQPLLSRLTRYVQTARQRLAKVHVNEGFAASNCDLSSALVPMAMDRVALGRHVARELAGPVRAARRAEAVAFSGAKFNKLDDLEGIVERGQVRLIIAGGLLALPLLWAEAQLDGRTFELGLADEVPFQRCEQACRLLTNMRRQQIELLLPIDFVLEDGSLVNRIPAGHAQRDVGPETVALFASRLADFATQRPGAVLFHNGVLGQFERPEFAAGTKKFIAALNSLHRDGLQVYVGGGEGATALERFGDPTQVKHCFTAGTTILKALGVKPIPYIWSLYHAARRNAIGDGDVV